MKYLRDKGYSPFITETYNPYIRRKTDLYHFIDIVALHPKETGVLGIQTTTNDHIHERIRKAEALPAYHLWLSQKNNVEFHGWRKLKGKWVPRIIRIVYASVLH